MSIRRTEYAKRAKRMKGLKAIPPLVVGKAATFDDSVLAKLPSAQLRADAKHLQRVGWKFVVTADPQATGLDVYRMADGRLGLSARTLNVKFSRDATPGDIEAVLAQHGLRKRRELGIGKKLLNVEYQFEPDGDLQSYSESLALDPKVDFAEPEFIESIGPRS